MYDEMNVGMQNIACIEVNTTNVGYESLNICLSYIIHFSL